MQSCLRLSVNAEARELSIDRPMLPPFLTCVHVLNLEQPFGDVDLLFEQQPLDVAVTVLRSRGSFDVRVVKSNAEHRLR
jgi:hypothetical protein